MYALPTDRHPCRPPTTQSLSLDGGCHHDELNPTVLKVILVSCAMVAAGMCHSQMRHFEGICSLAGVEFFFACGGLRAGEARQQHDRRAGERDALTRAAFESVELLQRCMAMRAQCSCLQCPMQLLASCVRCSSLVPNTLVSERPVICVLYKTMRHQLRCRKADFEHVLLVGSTLFPCEWFVRRE